MSQRSGSTAETLARKERDYILGPCKLKMRSSMENIEIGDYSIVSLLAGQTAELPRWVGEELEALGLGEMDEEPFDIEAFRALSKEKMMGPMQLSSLPGDFYSKMKRRLARLDEAVASGRAKKEDAQRLKMACYDLVGIRLSKLLSVSSSSSSSAALTDRLTPEESTFFAHSQALSKEWKTALMGGS